MLSKKVKDAVKLLESADKALKANKDTTKRKALEDARKKANEAVLKAIQEDEKKERKEKAAASEDENEEAEDETEDEGEDGPDPMDALKKHVPQQEGEDDQVYADRLGAVAKHAGGIGKATEDEEESEDEDGEEEPGMPKKKGMQQSSAPKGRARHRESALVRDFRVKQPLLYTQIMESARTVLSIERGDFKGLRSLVESQGRVIAGLKLERDLGRCEKMIKEAGIPAKFLTPGKLIKMEEGERKEEIERTLLIMESAGASRVFDGNGGGRSQESAGDGSDLEGFDSLGTALTLEEGEE